jgi:class 3 adenylate cyclase
VVAELIPNATVHELPPPEPYMTVGEVAAPLFDHVLEVLGPRPRSAARRQLGSILFTDVVSSTERVSQLGDARWGDILRRHEQHLRRRIDAEEGQLIKMIGDGSVSVFGGPAAAIRAARAVTADARELDIEIRAGVHTGECDRRPDGDLSGLAVHVAARVAAAAQPGEVWISRTVRDLIGGSGLQLASRGNHALKGLADEWELFCVLGQDEHARAVPSELSPQRISDRLALAAARRTPRLAREVNRIATNISSRRLAGDSSRPGNGAR